MHALASRVFPFRRSITRDGVRETLGKVAGRIPLEGEFPKYHSSADDLDLISADRLEAAAQAALGIIEVLEHYWTYRNLLPKGEPQLGKRGLYRGVGGPNPRTEQLAIPWIWNQTDGSNTLLEIADRSGLALADLRRAADALLEAGLLAEAR